jgi:hypothetical protein
MSLQLPFEPWLGLALPLFIERWTIFPLLGGRRPNKQSKRGCPFFLLLLLPQGERDSPRCNHSSCQRQEYPTSPHLGDDRGPQLVWLSPQVEPHFVPRYMDGWQVFRLGFNSLCTTLYGWMTSFWVGLIVCKRGNMTLYPSKPTLTFFCPWFC